MGMAHMIYVLAWQQQQACLLGFGHCSSRRGWPYKASSPLPPRLSSSAAQSKLWMSRIVSLFNDTLAERLRRRPAKPMGSPRVGTSPTGVAVGLGCGSLFYGSCKSCPHGKGMSTVARPELISTCMSPFTAQAFRIENRNNTCINQ